MKLRDLFLTGSGIIGGIFLLTKCIEVSQEEKERQEKERKRKNTFCNFDEDLTQDKFTEIAHNISKKIKRIKSISIENAVIYCTVESQTGYTSWDFNIDFNDWGHITGKSWINSQNSDSKIPEYFDKMMREAICAYL